MQNFQLGLLQYLIFLMLFSSCEDKKATVPSNISESNRKILLVPLENPSLPGLTSLRLASPKSERVLSEREVEVRLTGSIFNIADTLVGKIQPRVKDYSLNLRINNIEVGNIDTPSINLRYTPGDYVLLAFIEDKEGISIKDKGAWVMSQFSIQESRTQFNLRDAILFYNEPEGRFKNSTDDNVILDFLLANVALSHQGFKVRVVIDGETITYLTEWRPYKIEGLLPGEHTLRLELVNADSSIYPAPFNPSEAKFVIE